MAGIYYLYDYFLHISSATIIATFCVFGSLYGRWLCVVVMMSSPRTVAIFAIVANVRLCVPLSQRLTSVSVLPRGREAILNFWSQKARHFVHRILLECWKTCRWITPWAPRRHHSERIRRWLTQAGGANVLVGLITQVWGTFLNWLGEIWSHLNFGTPSLRRRQQD